MKKIAVGRYADSIFRIMSELRVTSHIGLHMKIFVFSSSINLQHDMTKMRMCDSSEETCGESICLEHCVVWK